MGNTIVNITLTVNEPTYEGVINAIESMGGKSIGGYAIRDSRFGEGARYIGGNLFLMGTICFEGTWNEERNQFYLKPFKFDSEYILASECPIAITGLTSGEKVLFKTEKDAKEWLALRGAREIMELTVRTNGYHGPAFGYR